VRKNLEGRENRRDREREREEERGGERGQRYCSRVERLSTRRMVVMVRMMMIYAQPVELEEEGSFAVNLTLCQRRQ
jgi:hypothetical protein